MTLHDEIAEDREYRQLVERIAELEAKLERATNEIREQHGNYALAPGMECECEFCAISSSEDHNFGGPSDYDDWTDPQGSGMEG